MHSFLHSNPPQGQLNPRHDVRPGLSQPASAGMTLALLLCCASAQAGRPLSTEDAGTNPQAQCQIEAWADKEGSTHASHFAPACGLVDGLELGLEWVKATPKDTESQGRSAALKWAPEWLSWYDWRFGAKLSTAHEKSAESAHWRQASLAVLGIVSVPIDPQWTVHLNLGRERNKIDQRSTTTYGAALVWTPHERWALFAELNGDTKTSTRQSLGLRYWLVPEQLGLDATTSRTNATPDSRAWGLGLGWYGLHF